MIGANLQVQEHSHGITGLVKNIFGGGEESKTEKEGTTTQETATSDSQVRRGKSLQTS